MSENTDFFTAFAKADDVFCVQKVLRQIIFVPSVEKPCVCTTDKSLE